MPPEDALVTEMYDEGELKTNPRLVSSVRMGPESELKPATLVEPFLSYPEISLINDPVELVFNLTSSGQ
jgi:hypothetical protein